jgi:tetratricopeptide (TPR) repeat protein
MRSTAILGALLGLALGAAVAAAVPWVAARAAEAAEAPAAPAPAAAAPEAVPPARPCLPPPPVIEATDDPLAAALRSYLRGRLLADDGNHVGAIEALRRAAALAPEAAHVWCHLGLALYDVGNVSGAVEAMDKALALAGDEPAFLFHRALADPKGAGGYLRTLLASAPKGSPYHLLGLWYQARAAQETGDADEAIACYEALLARLAQPEPFFQRYREIYMIYRGQVQLKQVLGNLYLLRGDGAKAVEILREALADRPDQPEILNLLCRAYLVRKDFAQARATARRMIEAHPEGGGGYQQLAETYRAEGHPEGVVADLQALRREHPENVMSAFQLAAVYEALGRESDAEAEYRALAALGDKAPGTAVAATVKLSEMHMKKDRPVDALEALAHGLNASGAETALLIRAARLIDALPQPAKVYADAQRLVTGMLAENLKRRGDAVLLYDQAIAARPQAAIAYSRKADLLIGAGRLEDALAVYQAALDAGLALPAFHRQMGLLLDRLNRMPEAIRSYRLAVEGSRKDKAALALLADALQRDGKSAEAEDALKGWIAESGADAEVYCQLAGVYLARGDLEAADRTVGQAIILDSQATGPRVLLAEVRFSQKRFDEAVKLARDVLEEVPGNAGLRVLLACALAGLKDFQDAVAEVKALLAAEPENVRWRYLLAGFYSEMGDAENAEKELLRILQKDPNHAGSNNDLGYLWADRGVNLGRAEQMIRQALKAEPRSPAYLDSLGWVLYKRGRLEEAVKALEAAVEGAPDLDAVLWDHLGDAYWRLSRQADASRAWEKAVGIVKARGEKADAGQLEHLRQKVESLRAGKPPDVAPLAPADQQGTDVPGTGKP